MSFSSTRRDVLKLGAGVAGMLSTGVNLLHAQQPTESPKPIDRVRVGFVGIGNKGFQHVRNLLHIEGVELRAVCDILEEPCVRTQRLCKQLDQPEPTAYVRGDWDFQRMCDSEELDLVYTATPWRWHVHVCLAAMKSGQHAATEIPAAITLDECWQLVETSEASGKYCSMMENVNYRQDELMIWNMIRKGLLGELVHAEVGYMHDTRYLKIRDYGDGLWLGNHHAERNGNLYPTHGLGPLAWYMNLNRGNRMEYLVSMSSKARGMNLFAKEQLPERHPKRLRDYVNGDVNSSLIQTTEGESILIKHDTDLPRPYSRTNLVQGTRGIVRGFPDFKVSLEEQSADEPGKHYRHQHHWKPGGDFHDRYDHPLWNAIHEQAQTTPVAADGFDLSKEINSGDYLEDYRLINALRKGRKPDFDVYDAASWSAVAALSEKSVANRSQAVEFPDFTKGKWKSTPPLTIMGV